MKLHSASLDPFDIRLVSDLRTSAGSVGDRGGLLLRVETDDGVVGIGEAAPIPGRLTIGLEAVAVALRTWIDEGIGADIDHLVDELDRRGLPAIARFAIHTALVDLQSRAAAVPLHQFLRAGADAVVRTNALVSADSPGDVHNECRRFVDDGFAAVKLKVAAVDTGVDATRIIAASEACGADVELRLDANQGWTPAEVEHVVGRVGPRRLGYIEDPVADRTALGTLAEATGVAMALDVGDGDALDRVAEETGATVLVIKPAAVGGIDRIINAGRRLEPGHRVVVSSSIDGTVGLLAGLHAAAALPTREVHGLATAPLVKASPGVLHPESGRIGLPSTPGLGYP